MATTLGSTRQVSAEGVLLGFLLVVLLAGVRWASADPIGTQWPQPDGSGAPLAITYSYTNLFDGTFLILAPTQLRAATEEAFALWASVAPLHFVEEPDSGPSPADVAYPADGHPDIRIGHHDTTDPAHGFFPGSDGLAGDIHFASSAPWTIGEGAPWDYLETIAHEIGHALGLDHTDGSLSIMNPHFVNRYDGLGTAFLFTRDIEDIRAVYGAGRGSIQPLVPVPEPATWLLLAAGLVASRTIGRIRPPKSRARLRSDINRSGPCEEGGDTIRRLSTGR